MSEYEKLLGRIRPSETPERLDSFEFQVLKLEMDKLRDRLNKLESGVSIVPTLEEIKPGDLVYAWDFAHTPEVAFGRVKAVLETGGITLITTFGYKEYELCSKTPPQLDEQGRVKL